MSPVLENRRERRTGNDFGHRECAHVGSCHVSFCGLPQKSSRHSRGRCARKSIYDEMLQRKRGVRRDTESSTKEEGETNSLSFSKGERDRVRERDRETERESSLTSAFHHFSFCVSAIILYCNSVFQQKGEENEELGRPTYYQEKERTKRWKKGERWTRRWPGRQ